MVLFLAAVFQNDGSALLIFLYVVYGKNFQLHIVPRHNAKQIVGDSVLLDLNLTLYLGEKTEK